MSDCICPHGERPLGRLHGISMGRGIVRLSTMPNCPEHDSCHGYTKAHRAAHRRGQWLWCPIHGKSVCPSAIREAPAT